MPKKILIIGSAHSGKSELAAKYLDPNSACLVFGTCVAQDVQLKQRIEDLKTARPGQWLVKEPCLDLPAQLQELRPSSAPILVDSISQWVASRLVDGSSRYSYDQLEAMLNHESELLLKAIDGMQAPMVLVTSEVSAGVSPAQATARLFRQLTGRLNAKIASRVSDVILVAAGIPLCIKGDAAPIWGSVRAGDHEASFDRDAAGLTRNKTPESRSN